jgi:3-oxoacyl-[acyl-carrier protein] reductase
MAPLDGRVALVTGVSRRQGIGFAIARRLLLDGASVFVSGWEPHDAEMPWGADAAGPDAVAGELDPGDGRFVAAPVDLEDPDGPRRLVDAAVERFGTLDVLVANHARSSSQDLAALTVDELDRCWAVNTRATLLLVQALAGLDRGDRPGGRVVLFTSGQHLAPMAGELPYSVTKGAIHQMTRSLADATADLGITVNCVNPGPVDTGWATGELHAEIAARFPSARWGTPADVANLVGWLASDDAAWITGQVIDSEGGFRRS